MVNNLLMSHLLTASSCIPVLHRHTLLTHTAPSVEQYSTLTQLSPIPPKLKI